MAFHPYLAFAGNCRDAFNRYKDIFGGELTLITLADAPPEAGAQGEGAADAIIHAALISDGQLLMGADDPSGGFDGQNRGMCVNCAVADAAEAQRVFTALADGGQVQLELGGTFFSPAFGMCTDRFGTPWMITADQPQDA